MRAISEVMTRDVTTTSPSDSLQRAAQMMRDWNIGSIPVCDGKRLVGMVTDRDITIRATAEGKAPGEVQVSEVMSDKVLWCFEDQTIGEVLQEMGDEQVRRIPVVSRDMALVGIVSLGDLSLRADAESALEDISTPAQPNLPSKDETRLRH